MNTTGIIDFRIVISLEIVKNIKNWTPNIVVLMNYLFRNFFFEKIEKVAKPISNVGRLVEIMIDLFHKIVNVNEAD